VSVRLLAVITPGDEAGALASLAGLVTIARAAEAEVRLAYFRDLPAPRVDRHDHVVADTDAEMARIASVATRALGSAARVFDDVKMETVVRFGKPRREVPIEAEVYAPQIVVLFAAAAGLLSRFRAWALRRRLARRPSSRMLVLEPPRRNSRSATATPGRSERRGVWGAISGPPM
jgi:nucleotide-binding universal stress UspA family protein